MSLHSGGGAENLLRENVARKGYDPRKKRVETLAAWGDIKGAKAGSESTEDTSEVQGRKRDAMKLAAVFVVLCLLGVATWGQEVQEKDWSLETLHCRRPQWYRVSGLCVRFIRQGLNFNDAEKYCASIGTGVHLVSAHDNRVNYSIGRFARHFRSVSFWVGAERKGGRWAWTDGSAVDYMNFRKNPPATGRSCVTMHGGGMWDAVDCNLKLSFICAWKEPSVGY